MSVRPLVLDASAGVKWFRAEPGSAEAYELLRLSAAGEAALVVPVHFIHEVLNVVQRSHCPGGITKAWALLKDSGASVVGLTDEVVEEAARQCAVLGCSFYDALAPAVAALVGATLVSADAEAHSRVPGVRLIG